MSNCSYGQGSRIKLQYTRKIIDAIHSGSLLNAEYKKTEIFGLEIPTEVEGVPSEILDPVNTVSDPRAMYLFYSLLWHGLFLTLESFLSIAVVKQKGIQGDATEVGWIVQEQFWNLHQPQDWQGQQQPDRRDSRRWSNLLRQWCVDGMLEC